MSAPTSRALVLLPFLLFPSLSFAQVVINEVMYDLPGTDTGREWVELYNSGSNQVDLTGWKFLESASASNHTITSVQGSSVLNGGDYAVIVIDSNKFLVDWPGFSGDIFKASFSSLNNSGSTVIIKDSAGNVVDQVAYDSSLGGAGDGNSLQSSSGAWIAAGPTPGQANATTPSQQPQQTANTTTNSTTQSNALSTAQQNVSAVVSTHYSYLPLSDFAAQQSLKISAGRPRFGSVGSPIEFDAESNSDNGSVTFEWNFGDGSTMSGRSVVHTYEYPGTYAVLVSATSAQGSSISRTTVTVALPQLSIDSADASAIRITNHDTQEVNLYGWKLVSNGAVFAFPRDTIILPGKTVSFAHIITSLTPQSSQDIVLLTNSPTGPRVTVEQKPKPVLVAKHITNLQVAGPLLAIATTSTTPVPQTKRSWILSVKHFFGLK